MRTCPPQPFESAIASAEHAEATLVLLLDSSRNVYNTTVPTTCLPHTGFAGVWTPSTHAELLCDRTIHIHGSLETCE